MSYTSFKILMCVAAISFTAIFFIVVLPPFFENPDIIGAIGAGFVNPYASGYSIDVIFCWYILTFWVFYEAKAFSVKHGWVCLLLGIFPGVAVGFALYLIIRHAQVTDTSSDV